MNKPEFIRARGDEQVELRKNTILNAAKKLYKIHSFDDINILMIANEAKFTRSNIYRYYSTKEEIYLSVMIQDLERWVFRFERWLTENLPVNVFAEKWVENMLVEKRLLSLLSILSTKLEPNSSQEALNSFKISLSEYNDRICRRVQSCISGMTTENAYCFLMFNASLFIGTYPNMYPTEKQKLAMKKGNLPVDPNIYQNMLLRAVKAFITELLQ